MEKKNCFLIGTIFKLHGYKGNVVIYNENATPLKLNNIDFLLIEKDNTLIPFFIDKIRSIKPHNLLVKFQDINSEEEAKKYLKSVIYLQKKHLLKEEKEISIDKNLIGFHVNDNKLGDLGIISHIDSQTTQKLIYVLKDQIEFCFPMNDHFIKSIELKNKTINVEIPKEILDLN